MKTAQDIETELEISRRDIREEQEFRKSVIGQIHRIWIAVSGLVVMFFAIAYSVKS